jgi:hypothetical protein
MIIVQIIVFAIGLTGYALLCHYAGFGTALGVALAITSAVVNERTR